MQEGRVVASNVRDAAFVRSCFAQVRGSLGGGVRELVGQGCCFFWTGID